MIVATITQVVAICTRNAWAVISGFLLLTVASAFYLVNNFAINTDSSKLLSETLPWRQQEIRLDRAFPQRADQIVAVIDATTPEEAQAAAKALSGRLAADADLFRYVRWPEGDPLFTQNGLLFETLEEVRRDCDDLIRAQPFLGALAVDPACAASWRLCRRRCRGCD